MTSQGRKRKISNTIFQKYRKQFPVPLHGHGSSPLVTVVVASHGCDRQPTQGLEAAVLICVGAAHPGGAGVEGSLSPRGHWAERGQRRPLSPEVCSVTYSLPWPTSWRCHQLCFSGSRAFSTGTLGTLPLMQNFLWLHEKPNSAAEAHF